MVSWTCIGSIAGVGVLLLVQQSFSGGPGMLGAALTNAFHVPMFAAIALLSMSLLPRRSLSLRLLVCLGLAVVSEGIQILTPRDASLADIGLDMLGALPVLVAFELTAKRAGSVGARYFQKAAIWCGVAVVVGLFTAVLPVRVLLAYQARDAAFPELLTPDSWRQSLLVSSNSAMEVTQGDDDWPGFADRPVIELKWAEHRYPALTLSEVVPDWEKFTTLVVDAYLPEGPPIMLTAAVGHEGRQGTAARFRTLVRPGAQRLTFPLRQLLETAAQSPPQVSKLILHTRQGSAGRHLQIGSIRLE